LKRKYVWIETQVRFRSSVLAFFCKDEKAFLSLRKSSEVFISNFFRPEMQLECLGAAKRLHLKMSLFFKKDARLFW